MYTSEIYIRTLSIKVSPGSINLCLLPNVGEAQVRYWKKGILQPINCRWNHSLIFYRQMFWWSLSWRSIKLLYLDSSKVIPRKTAHTTNGRIKEVCKKNGKKTHIIAHLMPFVNKPFHPTPPFSPPLNIQTQKTKKRSGTSSSLRQVPLVLHAF